MRKAGRLLVEGNDDKHVLLALCQHHQIPESFEIIDKNGYENLRDTLDVELDRSGLERLGIIVDADENIASRWDALRGVLLPRYPAVPIAPQVNGTILRQTDRPTVGIWLMPDNSATGMLEHFIQFLVPTSDQIWPQAEKCVDEISDRWLFPTQHRIKALVHTWLAWQKEPGKPLGLAITYRYLDADVMLVQQFVQWIRDTFIN